MKRYFIITTMLKGVELGEFKNTDDAIQAEKVWKERNNFNLPSSLLLDEDGLKILQTTIESLVGKLGN